MERKTIAWLTNLMNIGVLSFLVLKNYNPLYGAVACMVAVLTILIAVLPEALTPGVVYNDDVE